MHEAGEPASKRQRQRQMQCGPEAEERRKRQAEALASLRRALQATACGEPGAGARLLELQRTIGAALDRGKL
jgi:hypothetical protein